MVAACSARGRIWRAVAPANPNLCIVVGRGVCFRAHRRLGGRRRRRHCGRRRRSRPCGWLLCVAPGDRKHSLSLRRPRFNDGQTMPQFLSAVLTDLLEGAAHEGVERILIAAKTRSGGRCALALLSCLHRDLRSDPGAFRTQQANRRLQRCLVLHAMQGRQTRKFGGLVWILRHRSNGGLVLRLRTVEEIVVAVLVLCLVQSGPLLVGLGGGIPHLLQPQRQQQIVGLLAELIFDLFDFLLEARRLLQVYTAAAVPLDNVELGVHIAAGFCGHRARFNASLLPLQVRQLFLFLLQLSEQLFLLFRQIPLPHFLSVKSSIWTHEALNIFVLSCVRQFHRIVGHAPCYTMQPLAVLFFRLPHHLHFFLRPLRQHSCHRLSLRLVVQAPALRLFPARQFGLLGPLLLGTFLGGLLTEAGQVHVNLVDHGPLGSTQYSDAVRRRWLVCVEAQLLSDADRFEFHRIDAPAIDKGPMRTLQVEDIKFGRPFLTLQNAVET
mmetsp:Transcript_81147/g.225818  ORF Transcript_81147/g.225818 Transcript_81147/m.225818 type:complete len:494 (+) Transcript_81147:701-2182(+)